MTAWAVGVYVHMNIAIGCTTFELQAHSYMHVATCSTLHVIADMLSP